MKLPQHVVHRRFASETVILNLQTGHYHGVSPTGGRVLAALEDLGDLALASRRLAEEDDRSIEQVQREVEMFCANLAALGLVELHEAPLALDEAPST